MCCLRCSYVLQYCCRVVSLIQLELCNTIDTTRYRDTKQYRSTSSFGIVGIDYATYNQTGDDFGSHFQLIWIKLVG